MEYPLLLPGFEDQSIIVRNDHLTSTKKILQNGTPAPRAQGRHQYLLRDDEGHAVVAEFKAWQVGPVPKVLVDGHIVPPGRRISVFEWIGAGLPHLLFIYFTMQAMYLVGLFAGETLAECLRSALANGIGLVGLNYGLAVLQEDLPKPMKYLIAFCLVSVGLSAGFAIILAAHAHHPH